MNEIVRGKRGRPRGKDRRPEKKWDPKTWEPTYDIIVMLSLTKSNGEIAEYLNYTPQTVSNVLTSPTGLAKKAELIQIGRDRLAGTFEARANQIADLGLKRLHEILTDDDKMQKTNTAFAAIDRALAVRKSFIEPKKGVTIVAGDVNNTQINQTVDKQVVFTGPQSEAISDGLAKLEEIKRLHAPK